ncbi:MAG: hypothetical protein QM715_15105 [Nibricoccus sp.]
MKLARKIPRLISGLMAVALLSVLSVRAEPTGFTASLTEENKVAIGFAKLSAEQLASLDAQVQREISVARQGDTPAFSTSFTRRRSPQQRKDAGLDQLMTPELKRLDELVALAVANRPAPPGPLITKPFVSTPPGGDWVEITPKKLEVHGEVTLAYMWGSGGRSGYGASMATTVSDPDGKFAFTVVLSQFNFNGRGSHRPGEYGCDCGW